MVKWVGAEGEAKRSMSPIDEPGLWGFPFFYWYQFGWVPVTALLIWIVYRKRR